MADFEQILFQSDIALVRLMELGPHEIGEKHLHSELFETVVCIEGEISMFVANGKSPKVLRPGTQASVAALLPHWLQNNSGTPAKYLLVQNGGAYDFCLVSV